MDQPNSAANQPPKNLQEEEQFLKVEELRLKVAALKKPEYKKIGTWTGLAAIFVAITGIVAQGVLYQIKSAKAQDELDAALEKVDSAKKQSARFIQIRDSLKTEANKLDSLLIVNTKKLETILDELDKTQPGTNTAINNIKQDINATVLDLQSGTSAYQQKTVAKPLNKMIEDLFSPKASTRGAAYNQIISHYSNSPEMVPALIEYADKHMDNQNGIYNTLVVLGHINYKSVPRDVQAIRSFADRTRNNGSKTKDRVDKLLQRLPN